MINFLVTLTVVDRDATRAARWLAFHRPSRYFPADLAEASILKTSAWSWYI